MKKMRTFHFLYGKNEDISFFYPWKIEDISFSLRKKWGHFIFLSLKNEATSFSLWRPLHEKWGHFIFLMAATSWKNEATSFSLWRPLHVFSHENLRIFFYIIKDTSYFFLNLKEIFISMIIYFYFSLFLRPLRVRALLEAFKYSLKWT